MKECIFWDSEDGKFINWEEVSFTKDKGDDFVIVIKEIDHIYSSVRLYDSFDYIGLNDINNNKIYADCSIVEFELIINPVCRTVVLNRKGVFKYDKDLCAYIIECIDEDRILIFSTSFKHIKNIKIIDTIQENKLGLIKE